MKVFLVGGAIRDSLLGIPFSEKDCSEFIS
jgi:tRNA nucleotidyltransferase/poly(A) polymerase